MDNNSKSQTPNSKFIKILLIEDNPGDAFLIKEMLNKTDIRFELKCIERLSSGIEHIKADGFDVILLDLGLPDCQGLDALIKLNKIKPKAPVIVLTGLADEAVGIQAVKEGAQDYLIKGQVDKNLFARSINYAIERKKAEEALLEKEVTYRRLFDSMRDAFVSVDMQGRIQETNYSYQAMLGYSEEELRHLTYIDLTPEKWRSFEATLVEKQILTQGYSDIYEKEYRRKDGTIFPVELRTFLIRDDSGQPVGMWAIVRDITERKNAEEFISSILESVDEGFIVIDRAYRIISANKAFMEKTGTSLEYIIGEHCYEVSHHCNVPCYEAGQMCAVKQVFETGGPHTVIHAHCDVKGASVYVETKAYPLTKDESGKVITVIEILVDITEKKKTEERLKLLNECFLEFGPEPLENINRLVSLCGRLLGGACAFYNRLDKELLCSWGQWNVPRGYNPVDSPEGHICYDVIKSENKEVTVIRNLPETRYAQTDPNVTRYKLQTYIGVAVTFGDAHAGSLCVVYQNDFAPGEDDKRLLWIIASAIGTEEKRRQAEEMLKKLTHKMGLILNSAGEGIYGVDLEGKVIFINPAAARMLGYKAEELLGRNSHATWHHSKPDGTALPVEKCSLNEVLKEGIPVIAENVEFWEKGGKNFPVEYASTPMFEDDQLVGAVVTFRDITSQLLEEQERKKLEDQLRHAQKMEAIGTLAGGIAHDFNNILNVVLGYGTMVQDSLEVGSPAKEQMNEVLAAADRAGNLTRRLLLFSRKEVAEVKPMDVNEMVINTEKMLSRIIGEDIRFVADLMGTKALVMADAGQIEQVLMNLATNARDAMPNGGSLTIRTELREIDNEFIKAYAYGLPGTYAVISITDTGSGIDKEKQTRIFDPFFTTKEVGKGTGLGLSIAYGIIKQHNGYIKVYSETGKGTTFKIWLPVIEDTAEKGPEAKALSYPKGGTETILVAEDDDSLRILTQSVLEALGYSVITAKDGEDAIAKFMENREKIHLVMLDMIMPKKSGKEVSEAIREKSPGIKILFVSGYTMDIIKSREITEAGFDFILKPVLPKELLRKVREILDR